MNTDGDIRELIDGKLKPDEVPIDKLPNQKCNDCYGRGFQRYLIENISKVVPCHCVKKVREA